MTSGEKPFCDQVHAVVRRRHQTQVRGAIVAPDLFVIVPPLQKYNGLPLGARKAPSDSFRLSFHFCQQVVIALIVTKDGQSKLTHNLTE